MAKMVSPVVVQTDTIVGSSRMAREIRAFCWKETPLGPIEDWSEALITQVNIMLCSPFPAMIGWGEELAILFNDESLKILESAYAMTLGASYRKVFREVWHSPFGADVDACMARGIAARRQNVSIPNPREAQDEVRYWNYTLIPVYERGRIAGMLNMFVDTTAAVVTRLAMVRERADLYSLFEEAPTFIAVYEGPEHTYKMVNRSYVEMLGKRVFLGLPVARVFPEAVEQGFVAKLDEVYRTGKPFMASNARFTVQSGPRAGQDLYADLIYHPQRNVDGVVCGIIEMGSDVTEKRRVQQALIETEKVAAVGRLASSIAHEINNPLAAAVNYLYLAEISEGLEETRGYVAAADLELKRVSAISNQTLLSQKQSGRSSTTCFEAMVGSILPLYQGPLRQAGITVETRYRSCELFTCSEGEIRQVINNLISNAIDAMGEGGRLVIRARTVTDWSGGRCTFRLTVADTGVGIAPSAMEDVFRAFFTTKGFAGNGLGLWICKEIVARHEGRLTVRSSKRAGGSGSVFSLALPTGRA